MRRLTAILAGPVVTGYMVTACLFMTAIHASRWNPQPDPPAVTVYLPPCDDDAPGHPVTGTCWLLDDGPGGVLVRVFPYPYAPVPLYVLRESQ